MSESNGFATREQWLTPFQRKYNVVEIEGLGKVRIQNLTEGERQRVEAQSYRTKKGGGVTINLEKFHDQNLRFVVAAVVDGNGTPLFNNNDIDSLRERDAKAISQLSLAIAEHCGLSVQVEDLEKNSEGTPAAASQ